MTTLDFAILVPARNEESFIGRVVEECTGYCSSILVVDDGSSDRTGPRASQAGAAVLRNPRPTGLGAALELGLGYLKARGFRHIVTLDGDGAHDPSFIPGLLQDHTDRGADLTLGSRFLNEPSAMDMPSPKRAANFFATSLFSAITGVRLTDVISGMRVLGPRAVELKPEHVDYGFSLELVVHAIRKGLAISESPIGVRYDADTLFCTGRQELLENISLGIRIAERADFREQLLMLRGYIERLSKVSLAVDGRFMVLQPVPEHDGFVFQFQSPWYMPAKQELGVHPLIRISTGYD